MLEGTSSIYARVGVQSSGLEVQSLALSVQGSGFGAEVLSTVRNAFRKKTFGLASRRNAPVEWMSDSGFVTDTGL